ncbi:hypothetical protein CTAYLR_000892 [Chrysophaeum taylorii]|uniref:Rubicon Homology domain-containing protein n=1 Tax=Chrysophaeum taylorii TaxID=2483200 RepID=A0AAD7UGL6_9STRA|nr:hypothetical protein CTAYLR_000892 [Chrysophaeum taylorii]
MAQQQQQQQQQHVSLGLLGSLVRSALAAGSKAVAPEVASIVGGVSAATSALSRLVDEEALLCGVVSGEAVEAVAEAVEGALFFGVRPHGEYPELETPHFLDAIEKVGALREAVGVASEGAFCVTAHGRCRSVVRHALRLGRAAELALLKDPKRWHARSVCGDAFARDMLARALSPLRELGVVLEVACDRPSLDEAFVVFDSSGTLRLVRRIVESSHVEVTIAGYEAVAGVYRREDEAYRSATHELVRAAGLWYLRSRRSPDKVFYAAIAGGNGPPATGWRCLSLGILPAPVVREVAAPLEPAEEDPPSYPAVVLSAARLPNSSFSRARAAEIEQQQPTLQSVDTRSGFFSEEKNETTKFPAARPPPWEVDVGEAAYDEAALAALGARWARRVEAAKVATVEAMAERTLRSASSVVDRALAVGFASRALEGVAPAPPEEDQLTLDAAIAEATAAPQSAREAERAKLLWRAAWRDAMRNLGAGSRDSFEVVQAEALGVVVEHRRVYYVVRLGIERTVAFDSDSDGSDDEATGAAYAARLCDARTRRPRTVTVARKTLRDLENLETTHPLDARALRSLEEKILRRADDSNPLGRDAALASLAAPAVKIVDAHLDALRRGPQLKLFVDDALAHDKATQLTLGLWQPLRAASSASAEPPARPPGRRLPLSFAKEELILDRQHHRCAACGEPLHASLLAKNYAPCRLLDALVCKRRCHDDARAVLPWRVALAADFAKHRVSRAAATFLRHRDPLPLVRLPPAAPLFDLDPRLDAARQLRRRLCELKRDALQGRAGAEDATRLITAALGPDRLHLALDAPNDFWSLRDLLDATRTSPGKRDGLIPFLSDLIADATHAFSRAFTDGYSDDLSLTLHPLPDSRENADDDNIDDDEDSNQDDDRTPPTSPSKNTHATGGGPLSDDDDDDDDDALSP